MSVFRLLYTNELKSWIFGKAGIPDFEPACTPPQRRRVVGGPGAQSFQVELLRRRFAGSNSWRRLCQKSNFSVHLCIATILVFGAADQLNAFSDRDSQLVDIVAYGDIKRECYHFIYGIHRNLHIWEWSDSVVKHMLKTNLEDYLTKHLNTPESRKLHLKYEAVDWDIHAMMRMHLSCDE